MSRPTQTVFINISFFKRHSDILTSCYEASTINIVKNTLSRSGSRKVIAGSILIWLAELIWRSFQRHGQPGSGFGRERRIKDTISLTHLQPLSIYSREIILSARCINRRKTIALDYEDLVLASAPIVFYIYSAGFMREHVFRSIYWYNKYLQ